MHFQMLFNSMLESPESTATPNRPGKGLNRQASKVKTMDYMNLHLLARQLGVKKSAEETLDIGKENMMILAIHGVDTTNVQKINGLWKIF